MLADVTPTSTDIGDASAMARVLSLLYAGLSSQLVAAAAELRLADLLAAGPRHVADLAEHTGTDEDALYRALRALAASGIFTETTPRTFASTPMGAVLRSDVPQSLRDMARLVGSPQTHRTLAELEYSLRSGEPSFQRAHGTDWWSHLAENPEFAAVFYGAMGEMSRQVHASVIGSPELEGARTVVDVGGGHGHLLALLLRSYPDMTGVVLDLPEVEDHAVAVLDRAGVAARSSFVAGDFFAAVPGGGDVYLLSWILHDWSDDECVSILTQVRRALKPAGRLLVIDTVIPDGNAPHLGKLLDIVMLTQHSGRERTESELAALLAGAGLQHVKTEEMPLWPTGLMVATHP